MASNSTTRIDFSRSPLIDVCFGSSATRDVVFLYMPRRGRSRHNSHVCFWRLHHHPTSSLVVSLSSLVPTMTCILLVPIAPIIACLPFSPLANLSKTFPHPVPTELEICSDILGRLAYLRQGLSPDLSSSLLLFLFCCMLDILPYSGFST